MLRYSGHPFYDIGVATITVFSSKSDPSHVTKSDLDQVASFMEKQYVIPPLNSFLTVAFPNSGFTQPAYINQPEKRVEYARKVLRAYEKDKPGVEGEKCVFTGEPAVAVVFSNDAPVGRVFRQHIPLTTGEQVINFHPGGLVGLPVSGKALLCIHAFPLGCAKCAGRLLAVHSDDAEILHYYAEDFLRRNRESLSLAQASGSSKMPEYVMRHKTLLLNELEKMIGNFKEEKPFSVTAYHLSNSGQGPAMDIYFLPMEITRFLKRTQSVGYREGWQKIVSSSWRQDNKKGDTSSLNYLYEDIFMLPDNAPQFLSTYFLRTAVRNAKKGDPRKYYSPLREAELVSWKITTLFLQEVMDMKKDRIGAIRDLGDRLAHYIHKTNDKTFFRRFFMEQRYDFFSTLLQKANFNWVKKGNAPLMTFDPYIEIFEEGANLPYYNWRLTRDLLLIRMIEQLYEKGWLGSNEDVFEEIENESEGGD